MKSGGITDALKIIDIAEGAGLNTMVGCMVETKLANSAALNVVLGRKNVDHADLDGYSSIKIDITEDSMALKNGINYPYEGNGIGATVKPEYSKF
jgi:L-alanine-DL-glutamate epimerase-like enolase superfamily enzyme